MATRETKSGKGVTINVLGREFRVAAPEGEERAMLASVDLLNRRIKEIRDTGKVVGNERIAILAALNIAHEHLQGAPASGSAPAAASTAVTERKAVASTNNSSSDSDVFVRAKLLQFESMIERAVTEQEKLF